jgi:hypothetical protein
MREARAVRRWFALGVLVIAAPASGQSVRVTATSMVQAVDVRPLVEDSVPIGAASGTGPYRLLADGRLVRCIDGEAVCRFRRSGDRVTAMPAMQDLEATAWGFGEGVRVYTHVRARGSLGGNDFVWPRAEDRFDAIAAYVEVDRRQFRARLGRQWASNGLGLYNFDGAALQYRRGVATVEGFGGWSLVAGLNEPVDGSTLGAIDDLPPDSRGYLMGARVGARFSAGTAVAAVYQRVIRGDRAGLYSERVGVDASTRALGTVFDASYNYDLVAAEVNEAHLGASRELPARLSAAISLRHHRPFFEAWTIWGVFSPVAFDEARATVGWRSSGGMLSADASGAWRRYGETDAGLQSNPLRTDGWRAGVGAEWTPRQEWLAHADYNVDIGFGASRSDAVAGLRWVPSERASVGATISALQNIYEFRVGTGRILGVGIAGSLRVAREARLVVDGALYSHRPTNNAPSTDWSQRRASMRLEWTLGRDPGARRAERRGSGGGDR